MLEAWNLASCRRCRSIKKPAKGLVPDRWFGVFVPAGTLPAIIARLNSEMNKALTDQGLRDNVLQSAQEPVGGTAEHFSRLIHDDYEKLGRLVRELNIKANLPSALPQRLPANGCAISASRR